MADWSSMELALHEKLGGAYVEILDGELVRIHLPLGMTSAELVDLMGESLDANQLRVAVDLLSNDQVNRVFESKGDFVLIRESRA